MILKDVPNRRYLKIDEEGYFIGDDGARMSDPEFGFEALDNLVCEGNGSFSTVTGDTSAVVEPFDEPFVVHHIRHTDSSWTAQMPYEIQREFNLDSLSLDEWDRFHGRTTDGVPFVFSRNAQMEFFNLVDDYDDDSITVGGKSYQILNWLNPTPPAEEASPRVAPFWTKIYNESETLPWDLAGPHPAFQNVLNHMKLPRARIVVLGAGRSHDAAFFAQQGHFVTAIDFSPEAIEQARKLYGHIENLNFMVADAFNLPANLDHQFDVVVEHTCYCAIPPERRTELVKVWRRLLDESGYLFGIFFAAMKPSGPPFGGSEWEVRERLKKGFQFLYWTRWHFSIERRVGIEVVVVGQKK